MDTLTPTQLRAYLAHLHLHLQEGDGGATRPTLKQLVTANLRYIPFESLGLHYSPSSPRLGRPEVHISLDAVFDKIISPRNRGGYCMENNTLFGALLKTLGFVVWSTGARVSRAMNSGGKDRSGRFLGWNHMVNIVDEGDKRWLVDVGFGGSGPLLPIPLETGGITQVSGVQEHRLLFAHMKHLCNQKLKYWILQGRPNDGKEWMDLYAFSTEVEFFKEDFEVMNLSTSTTSIFVGLVCCVRTILGDEVPESAATGDAETTVGQMILNGSTVKRRTGGVTEVLRVCETEEQRIEAMEKWFGLVLTDEEREGIMGRPTEIKGEQKN